LTIRTWQDVIVDKLKTGEIAPEVLRDDLQDDAMLVELLARAGLPLLSAPASAPVDSNGNAASNQIVEGRRTKEEVMGWYERLQREQQAAAPAATPPPVLDDSAAPEQAASEQGGTGHESLGRGLESLYQDNYGE